MIARNTNNQNDHTIGIVGISSHQCSWYQWHHHTTPIYNEGNRDVGNGAGRFARVPFFEQFSGHTAVMSRQAGQVDFVRGFVPDGVVATTSMVLKWIIPILPFGSNVAGHWQDDDAIIADPTCVSIEINTTAQIAASFRQWVFAHEHSINRYSLKNADGLRSFNCVAAAETMLLNFLHANNILPPNVVDFETILLTYASAKQGALMATIISLPDRI